MAVSYDSNADYVLGRSPAETKRLMTQAEVLNPITERIAKQIGITTGMRVLDLGCGTGDVAIIIGRLVGPSGSVLGIDHDEKVLETAQSRIQAAGLAQVEVQRASVQGYPVQQPFDVVIGRLILFHQADPVPFLKNAARHVRAGGYLALQELAPLRGEFSNPVVPSYERACQGVAKAFHAGVPHDDVALRMAEHFAAAGLRTPDLLCETPIGAGEDTPLYAWVAETFHSLRPVMEKHGISGFEDLASESLESSLRDAAVQQRSQVTFATSIGAWAQLQ